MAILMSKPYIYKRSGRWWGSICGKEYADPKNVSNKPFPTLERATQWAYYPNEKRARRRRHGESWF